MVGILVSRTLLASGFAVSLTPFAAYAQERDFNIPEQAAETAVGLLGRQAGIQIIAARAVTHGRRTNAVSGRMSISVALDRLLADTEMVARQSSPQTFVILRSTARSFRTVSRAMVKDQ